LSLAGIITLTTLAVAAPHTWTLKNGIMVEGDYFSSGTTAVVVKRSGTNCILKISDLSTNDLPYLAEMQAAQRQARLDAEAKQMQKAGMIEFTKQMIESFPEKVDDRNGWMDVTFLSLSDDFVYPRMELGFDVDDKNGDLYMFCFAEKVFLPDHISSPDDISKSPHNPLIPVITNLKRGDKVRLIGKMINGSFYSQHRLFHVEKVEMIESAAEKKAREDASP
jgi:hypothetical protein